MNDALRTALLGGPLTVKEIATQIGKSESRTRELLKADQTEIHSKKEDGRGNVFWLPEARAEGTPATTTETEEPAELDHCPFCNSATDQVQAGPDGTFLGAANTCGTCGKTYNRFSGDEVANPKKSKIKRIPLNPQYKIDAKVAAVEAQGGKLSFDRQPREWILMGKNNMVRMTAQEFSVETPESLVAKL